MKKLSMEEYIQALEKMKRSPRDRLGTLGELGVTGLGVTAGIAISGTVAGAAGAATLAGSTTLASILGGVFITTTPIGWIIGSAAICGSLAYALGKGVRSGSKCDTTKAQLIKEIESRIAEMKMEANLSQNNDEKMANIITTIQYLVINQCLTQDKGTEILAEVEKKRLDIDEALEGLQELLTELRNG